MKTSGRPFQKGSAVHTARFLERDFRSKFALTAPLIPPTQAEGVAMMEFELQLELVLLQLEDLLMEELLMEELLMEELLMEELVLLVLQLELEPNLMMMKKLKMTALTMYYKLQ